MTNCDNLPTHNLKGGAAWNIKTLQSAWGLADGVAGRRQTERLVARHGLLPPPLQLDTIAGGIAGFRPGGGLRRKVAGAMIADMRRRRGRVIFIRMGETENGKAFLFANDARGGWHWYFRETRHKTDTAFLAAALTAIAKTIGKHCLVFFAHELQSAMEAVFFSGDTITPALPAYPESIPNIKINSAPAIATPHAHLDMLEAEAIHIIREAIAAAANPVLLYSIGKDSAALLHLAQKAFAPAVLPFTLLHVDTGWKFRAMTDFRDALTAGHDCRVIIHKNPEGMRRKINPFTHGSAMHTEIMKTEALKQALDENGFDIALGGARRDEEKSRAKERIASIRNKNHGWDARRQRPELWSLYNMRCNDDDGCMRVFPLSNWTEIDIWHYIHRENIPVVPLYFAKPRPVIEHDGALIMVDDDRMPDALCKNISIRSVRFRSLGCYPLSCAVESQAATPAEIILELLQTRHSERSGRVIDRDGGASMEDKKRMGYF